MKLQIASVVTIFALIGGVVGAVDYFAKDSDLEQVALRLDRKIKSDDIMSLQKRMWQIQDRYPGNVPMSEWSKEDKDEHRRLDATMKQMDEELKSLH